MNLFDFSDVSDLSEGLQKRLSGGGRVNPNIATYANIVKAAAEAGVGALSISMIECVAERMKLPTLSQQSIRNALVSAVKVGLIGKPTRQTYGVILKGDFVADETSGDVTDDTAEVPVSDALDVAVGDDPLA